MAKLPIPTDIFSDPFRRPVLINPKTRALCYVNGNGNYVPLATSPLPPDENTYPLKMDPKTPPGATVNLGAGPNQISLRVSSPMGAVEGGYDFFFVQIVGGPMAGKVVAGPLKVTGNTGQGGGQVFNINGNFGPTPLDIMLVPDEDQLGLMGFWWNGGEYDGDAFQYTGPSLNNRDPDTKIVVNQTTAWNNKGYPMRLSTADAVAPPVTPPTNSTIIEGATIDGKPVPAAILADLSALSGSGILLLPAGNFVGTAPMAGNTIQGAGMDETIIDATNLDEYHGKAILVPTASTAKIMDLWLKGAAGPDGNVAGIRQDGPDISFEVERVRFTGNQDGVLTFPAPLMKFTDCIFENNGAGNAGGGATHEAYFNGTPDSVVEWLRTKSTCGDRATHAFKSRAGNNQLVECELTGNPGTPDGGAIMDLPNGGSALIQRTTLRGSPGAANRLILSYAVDLQSNLGDIVLEDVTLIYAPSAEWYFVGAPGTGGRLIIRGKCTYPKGCQPPSMPQWAEVQGAFTEAA